MRRQSIIDRFVHAAPGLEGGLDLDVEPLGGGRALVRAGSGEHRFRGVGAALGVPYPSGLRRLRASEPDVEVVLLERASPGLDRAAREEQVSYLDLAGRGRLMGPGFVYVAPPPHGRVGAEEPARPALPEAPRSRVSPFAPKASRIVRAFLSAIDRRWRLSELADACRMNPGNVHRVLGALRGHGFVEREAGVYLVADAGSLLEAWAEHARPQRDVERIELPVRDDVRRDAERVLELLAGRAAISGELAAEVYAPHLVASHAIVHCLDEDAWDRERLADAAADRPLRPRGRIAVDLVDEGVGDFGADRGGLPLAAPAQVYVDLYGERSRGREAAAHLRREVLRF